MEVSVEEYLIDKGYPISSKGGLYYSTLLEEVVYSLENNETDAQIKKELPEIAYDYYTGFFQVDRSDYYTEIKRFCFSSDERKKDVKSESLEKRLIRMGKEYLKINGIEVKQNKVMSKRK